MVRIVAMLVALAVVLMGSALTLAQETQPRPGSPGGGMMGPGMGPGQGGGMMMCPMMGMMGMTGGMGQGGMMGGMPGMGMMAGGDPKAAARAMRLRADMMQAMSEVLGRHAEQLEKGQ